MMTLWFWLSVVSGGAVGWLVGHVAARSFLRSEPDHPPVTFVQDRCHDLSCTCNLDRRDEVTP